MERCWPLDWGFYQMVSCERGTSALWSHQGDKRKCNWRDVEAGCNEPSFERTGSVRVLSAAGLPGCMLKYSAVRARLVDCPASISIISYSRLYMRGNDYHRRIPGRALLGARGDRYDVWPDTVFHVAIIQDPMCRLEIDSRIADSEFPIDCKKCEFPRKLLPQFIEPNMSLHWRLSCGEVW